MARAGIPVESPIQVQDTPRHLEDLQFAEQPASRASAPNPAARTRPDAVGQAHGSAAAANRIWRPTGCGAGAIELSSASHTYRDQRKTGMRQTASWCAPGGAGDRRVAQYRADEAPQCSCRLSRRYKCMQILGAATHNSPVIASNASAIRSPVGSGNPVAGPWVSQGRCRLRAASANVAEQPASQHPAPDPYCQRRGRTPAT